VTNLGEHGNEDSSSVKFRELFV